MNIKLYDNDRILFTVDFDININEGVVLKLYDDVVKLKVFRNDGQYYFKWYYIKNIKLVRVLGVGITNEGEEGEKEREREGEGETTKDSNS